MQEVQWSKELIEKLKTRIIIKREVMSSSLCGCKVHDVPMEIRAKMKLMGYQMAADYFFKKVQNRTVRAYFMKNKDGRFSYFTLYLPTKFKNKEYAENKTNELKQRFEKIDFEQRENWIDIYLTLDLSNEVENISSITSDFSNKVQSMENILMQVHSEIDKI